MVEGRQDIAPFPIQRHIDGNEEPDHDEAEKKAHCTGRWKIIPDRVDGRTDNAGQQAERGVQDYLTFRLVGRQRLPDKNLFQGSPEHGHDGKRPE